jgi:hypothetical protein
MREANRPFLEENIRCPLVRSVTCRMRPALHEHWTSVVEALTGGETFCETISGYVVRLGSPSTNFSADDFFAVKGTCPVPINWADIRAAVVFVATGVLVKPLFHRGPKESDLPLEGLGAIGRVEIPINGGESGAPPGLRRKWAQCGMRSLGVRAVRREVMACVVVVLKAVELDMWIASPIADKSGLLVSMLGALRTRTEIAKANGEHREATCQGVGTGIRQGGADFIADCVSDWTML